MADRINEILANRGTRYGAFADHAQISMDLKRVIRASRSWANMTDYQKEGLDMILHKVARIVNGDPDYDDSWVDICGYAQLVVDELRKMTYERQHTPHDISIDDIGGV